MIPILAFAAALAAPQEPPAAPRHEAESHYYRIVPIPVPAEAVLEVGGLDARSDGTVFACTRRGDVWAIAGALEEPPRPKLSRFASGLHEPLGLLLEPDGSVLCVQRGELTRLRDLDGDGRADLYEPAGERWPITGNYHEYSYGPKRDREGSLWATLNVGWTDRGESLAPWRGWAVRIAPGGALQPWCAGLRSPAGLGANATGDFFYTDNQGDWVPTCKLAPLARGSFQGHADSLKWCGEPGSPLASPGEPPDELPYPEAKKKFPALQLPAVWFPYKRMGQSASDILCDTTGGQFGPFGGQLFVGDQTTSEVMRVFLEKVGDGWQGACFPFRSGFSCGIVRLAWAPDGSMLVGMTNRGWGSVGPKEWGLERVVWDRRVPFEVKEMRALPDGFELVFTEPVDPVSAAMPAYALTSFTYLYHHRYGSEEIDKKEVPIDSIAVAADGLSVRLATKGLREGYVHELRMPALRSRSGAPLLHAECYYTLNAIPKESPPK